MKVIIKGTTYSFDSVEKLTLKELLQLEIQSEDLGRRLTMAKLRDMQASIGKCKTNAEREDHPDALMLFGVGVWVARRRAGEDIAFGDALDFDPQADMTVIVEESDKQADPTLGQPVSGLAVKRPADRARKTSKPRSSPASS